MFIFQIFLEAFLVTSALSMDALVSGFAYGTNKIKIPFISIIIIDLICTSVLAISLFMGVIISSFIPKYITIIICVTILIILGLAKIFDSYLKSLIRNQNKIKNKNLKFLLNVYTDNEEADFDKSKSLSGIEAATLAVALSFDGLAVGIGAGLISENTTFYFIIIIFSLFINFIFIVFGCFLGNKIIEKYSLNLEWISGLFLIGIAIMKILI